MEENQIKKLRLEIIKKCFADPEFKQALLENPREAIKRKFNIDLPKDIQLNVVEESPKTRWLVLPFIDTTELTAEELSALVGGKGCCGCVGDAP